MKAYVVGTHQKRLCEALLMSTHNICFHGEIRKISAFFGWKKRLICCYDYCLLMCLKPTGLNGKQSRSWPYVMFSGIWSGSTRFGQIQILRIIMVMLSSHDFKIFFSLRDKQLITSDEAKTVVMSFCYFYSKMTIHLSVTLSPPKPLGRIRPTCYISSPHDKGVWEQYYFSLGLSSVHPSVMLSPPKPLTWIQPNLLHHFPSW